MSPYFAYASRFIDADPQTLFDIVADPSNHSRIDGSGSVNEPLPGTPDRLYLGARFGMNMNRKFDYRIRSRVTEFVDGRIIAWVPLSGHTWRYTFTPHDGGTFVTEEWDARGVWNRYLMKLAGVGRANHRAMVKSLVRLEQLATAAA